jgi:hypothetical protein
MMMRIAAGFVMIVLPLAAQDKKETVDASGYKVVYTIRDDKTQRHFTLLVDSAGRSSFRAGNRVPVASMSMQPAAGTGNASVATQYNYFDVGITIDCRLRHAEGKLVLNSDLDISTIVEADKRAGNPPPNPTVASVRVSGASAVVAPGKPVAIASIDDPVTNRRLDIVATVTRLD